MKPIQKMEPVQNRNRLLSIRNSEVAISTQEILIRLLKNTHKKYVYTNQLSTSTHYTQHPLPPCYATETEDNSLESK